VAITNADAGAAPDSSVLDRTRRNPRPVHRGLGLADFYSPTPGAGAADAAALRERVTILATGKCVAACRRAVLQWPRRAARTVLCIGKEVPAMFANRQTPPRVAL
jgi:hypothetical protein